MINEYSNEHNKVKIPTGRRQTSWLFTCAAEKNDVTSLLCTFTRLPYALCPTGRHIWHTKSALMNLKI